MYDYRLWKKDSI